MAQELVQLQPGSQVERWTIDKKLGEGGFGAVYKVSDSTGQYALKVEGISEGIQVLKMEVFVLSELAKRGGRHFCKIEDKGRFGTFNYVVMTLVGKSLQDLRKEGPGQHMSMGTAISSGIQCLESLEDLHGIGYLHRDVKPGNYTIGRVELQEQHDVETWVYMIVELTTGNLPWKNVQDMNAVGDYKRRCRSEPFIKELFGGCPREYVEILQYVDGLKYYDAPNYQMCYQLMRKALVSMNAQEFPYDWEKAGGMF
uniref:Protein kinase domain-containing protein n=2 Tax=Panagrolaimus sp. ES5 TaxID=591445 RepID=A0AC34FED7_9BILA